MSMFVLNSVLSERYPTVTDGLIYTYPFDGEMHCCIHNLKYAKVLIINNGSDKLYKIFQSEGSLITKMDLDIDLNTGLENLSIRKGQYNLIAIDAAHEEITENVIKKIKEISNNTKVSTIIHCLNSEKISYNYGGSYVYTSSIIKKEVIGDAITKSLLYESIYNVELLDNSILISNGFLALPWDNRIDNFSICFDLEIDNYNKKVDLISIKNNSTLLMNIYFDASENCFAIKTNNVSDIKYNILDKIDIFDSKHKITIIKNGYKIDIFCNNKLCLSVEAGIATKGNALVVGRDSLTRSEEKSVIRIANLSIYNKHLSLQEVDVLNKGRLIFT